MKCQHWTDGHSIFSSASELSHHRSRLGTANPHIDIAEMPALHAFPSKKEKSPGPLVSGGIPIRVTLPLRIERMMSHGLEGRKFGAASVV